MHESRERVLLASWYREGQHGLDRDLPLSFSLAKRACEHQDSIACNLLGQAYEKGLGVSANKTRAIESYQSACKAGNDAGCENLKRIGKT